MELVETGEAVMVCPEVIGGLPIPRDPAEIIGAKWIRCVERSSKSMDDKRRRCNGSVQNGAIKAYQKLQENTLI
ncbi:2-thiouracil desulfurase family protein [Enterococcus faecium]|nr:2-thiouracil desulfurase family protein [Enterococcus faecium]